VASLKKNIIANLIGSIWVGALSLIVTPFQVKFLGIEAYAIVGFLAILQVVLSVLDLGLSTTITQQVAADTSQNRKESRNLIQSVTAVYWAIALIIGIGMYFASPIIAARWFKASRIDQKTLENSLFLIGLFLALRWPVALYSGILSGLQRLELVNGIKTTSVTIRQLIGLWVLMVTSALTPYLIWNALSAVLEVLLFAFGAFRNFPGLTWAPKFNLGPLKKIWRFSISLNFIAILSMLLTQVDRLMMSKLLSLESLGYYSVAYNAAISLSLIQTAVSSAILPAFAEDAVRKNRAFLENRLNKASQLILFSVGLPAFLLAFYGHEILTLWINPVVAEHTHHILSVLAFGFLFNSSINVWFVLSVACGRPSIPLRVNLLGAALYIPGLYFLILKYGPIGAAYGWLALNAYFVISLYPFVQILILKNSLLWWPMRVFFPFLALGGISFFLVHQLFDYFLSENLWKLIGGLVLGTLTYLMGSYLIFTSDIKRDIRNLLSRFKQASK